MATAAQRVVEPFDFDSARRFIESRSRQLRAELRVYAMAAGVLVVAGVVQHAARRSHAPWTFDRTDGLMLVVLGVLVVCAIGRLRVLTSVYSPLRARAPDALRAAAGREAARVRQERVTGAAASIIAALALGVAAVDAALDRDWVFTACFAGVASGSALAARRYIGRRAVLRAERYIAGEIDAAEYTSGQHGA